MQEHTKIKITMNEIINEAKEIKEDFFNYVVNQDPEKAKQLQTFVQDFASDTKLTKKLVENLKFKLATAKLSDLTSEEIEAADVVAIVAPINLQQQFLKLAGGRPVIMAVNDRVLIPAEDGGEQKVEFRFIKWERLLSIKIEKEDYIPE